MCRRRRHPDPHPHRPSGAGSGERYWSPRPPGRPPRHLATALALTKHRACNAWFQDDHIRYWTEVHIGVAVAVEDGLITPVIRNADLKPLLEIGREARELAEKARSRRLQPSEYTGATFSVSNLGMFEIDQFTAVINPPEAGIIAVGTITPKPGGWDGQGGARP